MRRVLTFAVPAFALLALAGCPKKWQNGECETSEHCKDQVGYGKVCVQGRCQECGADTDCKEGFVCRDLRCVPRPECASPSDCASGRTCQDGRCVAIPGACGPGLPCPSDQDCVDGRCAARAPVAAPQPDPCDKLEPVYFDFDRSDLRPESQTALQAAARCVAEKRIPSLRIEGNCDERGTTEYNIHLGQRRAEAVKRYLVGLGVAASSISVVSHGEERPVCTEHGEPCWQRNRRADTVRQ